jgi:hypothetical protein
LYSREEIERMAKGLPAQEPEPKPVTTAAAPEFTSVLAPATRNKPMLQLILERRKKS